MRRAEIIFSANYFGFDDTVNVDGERIGDRIRAIPFEEMEDMTPREFTANQKRFKAVLDSEEKPTTLLIGEIGDFLHSPEFLAKRDEFSEVLHMKSEETIKPRTLNTNYGGLYAVLWKLHSVFEPVWAEKVKFIVRSRIAHS